MDWGLGNPNKTAALIACLMAACWLLAGIRRGGFAMALGAFAGLGACLIHTYSRGGVAAAAAGQLVLLACAPRPWPRGKAMAVAIAVAGLAAYASWDGIGAARRFAQSPAQDRSITNRIAIWRAAPRMMVDAPRGWGPGRAGWAYAQWYQAPSTRYEYRTLVNSHMTWLVEAGWAGRCAYVFATLVALALCWPRPGGSAVPLAIWAACLVAALFSSTLESPPLWMLPGVALAHALWHRTREKRWPSRRTWLALAAAALAAIATLAALGLASPRQTHIHGSPSFTHVGSAGPAFLLADPDPRVLGSHYGAEIRRLASDPHRPSQWLVMQPLQPVPAQPAHPIPTALILSGQPSQPTLDIIINFSEMPLVWLNPADGASVGTISDGRRGPTRAFFGQRRSDSGARETLDAAKARGIDHEVVRGAAWYLRQWPSYVVKTEETVVK